MCEPYHSVLQFPNENDDGTPLGPVLERAVTKRGWLKRILGWFHISKMGSGHSETLNVRKEALLWLPQPYYYENAWWERTVRKDISPGRRMADFPEEALEAAKEYSDRVVTGSLPAFRRFLETSMQTSESPHKYVENFILCLNQNGQDQLYTKLKRICNISSMLFTNFRYTMLTDPQKKRSIISTILGFTRKRELLVPVWADDNQLWLPNQKKGEMLM